MNPRCVVIYRYGYIQDAVVWIHSASDDDVFGGRPVDLKAYYTRVPCMRM